MTHENRICRLCDKASVYTHTMSWSSSGNDLLPGVGSTFKSAKIDVYVCSKCGDLRMVLNREYRSKVADSSKWRKA